jgi:hypothetical protein
MDFLTASDNRAGDVRVDPGDGNDSRDGSYSVDPGSLYYPIKKTLLASQRSGNGQVTTKVDTSSEFLNVDQSHFSCNGLTFSSTLTIALPDSPHDGALAIVNDRISMGVKITQPIRIRLQSSITSDVDVAFIQLIGPASSTPLNAQDNPDQLIQLTALGVYTLIGSARLAVRLPNHSLGGRPLAVQISATLTKG